MPVVEVAPVPRPWGIWSTLGWGVLAVGLGQAAAALALFVIADNGIDAWRYDGPVVALTTMILNPVQIAVVAAAARWRGIDVFDYFGQVRFRASDFGAGVVAAVALGGAIAVYAILTGRPLVTPFQIETLVTTPTIGWLVLLGLAIVVVAPFGEEVLFRGFLFRGWVRPDRNPLLPIVAIAIVWTLLHVQYDWFGMMQVFLLGLLFGWLRWRSGSTLLTFVLHALVNFESAVETVVKVGWNF